MRSFRITVLLIISLLVSASLACTVRSKVDSVVEGFFAEVNNSNFETAKTKYLSSVLISRLESPLDPHKPIKDSFGGVAGYIKTVEVSSVQATGESATATTTLLTPWGTKYNGTLDLIKQGGQDWKINDWREFNAVGRDHALRAVQECGYRGNTDALNEFQAAFSENPQDAGILNDWGWCYFIKGDDTNAEAKFKQAIDMYPNVVWDPYINLALIDMKRNDLKAAAKALKKAVSNRPDARTYAALASFYAVNAMNLDDAIELAQKGLALAPDDPSLLDAMGWAYYRSGKREQAIPYEGRAMKQAPNNPVIRSHYFEVTVTAAEHLTRAQELSSGGQYDEAVSECEATLRQEPNNEQAKSLKGTIGKQAAQAHVAKANQEFDKQQYNPALAECEVALKYDPQNSDAAGLKAKITEVKKVLNEQ
jgi:tetratricopeptide (TPR) repeat protein